MGRGGAPVLGRPRSLSGIRYPDTCVPIPVSYVPILVSYVFLICFAGTAAEASCSVQVSGQLVLLGYAVAGFTPAAYRRRRLRRPLLEV